PFHQFKKNVGSRWRVCSHGGGHVRNHLPNLHLDSISWTEVRHVSRYGKLVVASQLEIMMVPSTKVQRTDRDVDQVVVGTSLEPQLALHGSRDRHESILVALELGFEVRQFRLQTRVCHDSAHDRVDAASSSELHSNSQWRFVKSSG